MKKLRLDLEELAVESFDVASDEAERGTVAAHAYETDPRVCDYTEDWNCSVGYGCTLPKYTCAWTCGGPVTCYENSYGAPCA